MLRGASLWIGCAQRRDRTHGRKTASVNDAKLATKAEMDCGDSQASQGRTVEVRDCKRGSLIRIAVPVSRFASTVESHSCTPRKIAARRGTGMPVSPRCPACRIVRREERNARVMESLRSGDVRRVQPQAVGPSDGAERLYTTICSDCRRPIRLPFKPRLDRPIFCRFCHDERQGR